MRFFRDKEKSIDPNRLPNHVGIIMDGNGRWAQKKGLPRYAGHIAGAKVFKTIAYYARDIGLKNLTVYAFSTENWSRPQEEVSKIMTVLEEFIDGTSVADLLTAGLFNEEGAKKICAALCDGLYALHLSGIIHRDIKPENVMIENGGRVVLIDYEAARIFKCGRSKDTCILGTAGYAAPEQFGITQTDERSDVYSLGILLNVLLTGCHPSVTLYGGRLGKVIERCTHIDPAKRFKNTAELKNFL